MTNDSYGLLMVFLILFLDIPFIYAEWKIEQSVENDKPLPLLLRFACIAALPIAAALLIYAIQNF